MVSIAKKLIIVEWIDIARDATNPNDWDLTSLDLDLKD